MDNLLPLNTIPESTLPVEVEMADSQLPAFDWDDEKKRVYLSFRICGFSRRESIAYTGVTQRTIYNWRAKDPAFKEIEQQDVVSMRRRFSKEAIMIEYTRNLRLVLKKDFQILDKALTDPTNMTKDETSYLGKIRAMYSPQQLQAIESLIEEATRTGASYEEVIISARRVISNGQNQETQETPLPSP